MSQEIGYHVRQIPKERYGTFEKITEEFEELLDAHEQNCRVMELVEMSDLIGAIEGYLEASMPGFTLTDLLQMKYVTRRAFEHGTRSNSN